MDTQYDSIVSLLGIVNNYTQDKYFRKWIIMIQINFVKISCVGIKLYNLFTLEIWPCMGPWGLITHAWVALNAIIRMQFVPIMILKAVITNRAYKRYFHDTSFYHGSGLTWYWIFNWSIMKSQIPKPFTSSPNMLLIWSLGHSKITNCQHKIHCKWKMLILVEILE